MNLTGQVRQMMIAQGLPAPLRSLRLAPTLGRHASETLALLRQTNA